MNGNAFRAVAVATLLAGCMPAVRVTQPGDAVYQPVTAFSVRFHEYYQTGTFRAFLDGQEVTSSFSPAGVPKGTAGMVWRQPFIGGEPASSDYRPPLLVAGGQAGSGSGSGGGVSPPSSPPPSSPGSTSGTSTHTLLVTGSCIAGTACQESDEQKFNPVVFIASPSQIAVSAGSATTVVIRPDRPLQVPVDVTIEPFLITQPPQPAMRVRVNGAAPGAPTTITLPVGSAGTIISVAGLPPAGWFYLLLSAPGTQRSSAVGYVN
ncbi:MAG TPA: hypothetical protein VNG69_12770 [Casimicrobiaceae bacterium]|nr:hypothetical protein [Casimicrobiaceae bacterium]